MNCAFVYIPEVEPAEYPHWDPWRMTDPSMGMERWARTRISKRADRARKRGLTGVEPLDAGFAPTDIDDRAGPRGRSAEIRTGGGSPCA